MNLKGVADRSSAKIMQMMNAIPEYNKGGVKEKESPLESLVKKFERQGYTVEQAFHLFDENGDGLLTSKEVRAGFRD